jgi:hypothetical protein
MTILRPDWVAPRQDLHHVEEHPGHGRWALTRLQARAHSGEPSSARVFIQAAWGPAVPAILVCAGSPDRVVQEAGG